MPMSLPEGSYWFLLMLEEHNTRTSLHPHPCPVIRTPASPNDQEKRTSLWYLNPSLWLSVYCLSIDSAHFLIDPVFLPYFVLLSDYVNNPCLCVWGHEILACSVQYLLCTRVLCLLNLLVVRFILGGWVLPCCSGWSVTFYEAQTLNKQWSPCFVSWLPGLHACAMSSLLICSNCSRLCGGLGLRPRVWLMWSMCSVSQVCMWTCFRVSVLDAILS